MDGWIDRGMNERMDRLTSSLINGRGWMNKPTNR